MQLRTIESNRCNKIVIIDKNIIIFPHNGFLKISKKIKQPLTINGYFDKQIFAVFSVPGALMGCKLKTPL